jgi:copper(I)-binding protein
MIAKRRSVVLLCAALVLLTTLLSIFSPPAGPAAAHEGGPHLRAAHLAPTAGSVDIYLNGQATFTNLAYRDVTAYKGVTGYSFDVIVVKAGGTLAADAYNKDPFKLTFKQGDSGNYTIAAVGALADGTFTLIMLPADGPAPKAAPIAREKASVTAGALTISEAYIRPVAVADDHHDDHQDDHQDGTPAMGAMPGMSATPDSMPGMNMPGMDHDAGPTTAGYMLIANSADADDTLVSVTVDPAVAGSAAIHETKVVNDVASMQPVTGGLTIPAKGQVALKPASYHLMIIDVKQTLAVGDAVKLTFKFKSGVSITLDVPVLEG